jgi:hypothetical protein
MLRDGLKVCAMRRDGLDHVLVGQIQILDRLKIGAVIRSGLNVVLAGHIQLLDAALGLRTG